MTKMTKATIAKEIEGFLSGQSGDWDWDDFISVKIDDPELDRVRIICAELPARFPAQVRGAYCSDEGLAVLRNLLENLRKE